MNESDMVYAKFLSTVVRSDNFKTIFFFAPEDGIDRCHMANWRGLTVQTIPWLTWTTMKSFKLLNHFDSELLFLACLPGVYRQDLLNIISTFLQHIRKTKMLIELSTDGDVSLVNRVLHYCLKNYMLNVAVYLADFKRTHVFYTFDAFPSYALRNHQFGSRIFEFFPDKMINLKGYQLITQPDLSEPNTILYYDNEGNPRFLGYVWNLVEEYSRKHNARLQLSFMPELGRTLTKIQVIDLAREGLVDISASIQPMTFRLLDFYHHYSYPIQISNWCTMLPLEPYMNVREFYGYVLPVSTVLFLVALYPIYQLMKGRWEHHNRLLCIGWFVLIGLMAFNVQGRLVTLFVVPPARNPIKSFAELQHSKIRIHGLRYEYNEYDFDMRTKYASIFYLTDSILELIAMRNSLNTSYAYTITNAKWLLYAEQQAHSSSPLFYFSEDLCYFQFVPFSLIIPENSPHYEPLHTFTLQIVESGIYTHWLSNSFYYMVQAGRLRIRDLGETRHSHSLMTQDLRVVLFAYAIGVLISFIILVGELIFYWLYN